MNSKFRSDNQISLKFTKDSSYPELPSDIYSDLKKQEEKNLRLLNLGKESHSISSIQVSQKKIRQKTPKKEKSSTSPNPKKNLKNQDSTEHNPREITLASNLNARKSIAKEKFNDFKTRLPRIPKKIKELSFENQISQKPEQDEDSIKTIKFKTQSKQKNSLKKASKNKSKNFKLRLGNGFFVPTKKINRKNADLIKNSKEIDHGVNMNAPMITNTMFPINQNAPFFNPSVYNAMMPMNIGEI